MAVLSTPIKSNSNSALVVYRVADSATILATSSKNQRKQTIVAHLLTDEDRPLLSDKQKPFAHLKPKQLVISTIRVVMKQAAEVLAHFLSNKLEQEKEMDDLIQDGKLTVAEADNKTQDWDDREWNLILKTFPQKAWTALWKFHAATLLCRLYEGIADVVFDNNEILDKLTLDVFKSGKRTSKAHAQEPGQVTKSMFTTCLWANAILYLADFSVHEILLTVGYYRMKRSRRVQQREEKEEQVDTTSLAKKSASLAVSRTIGWVAASAGGAVGTVLYPGWGTLLGVNMGDSVVASILEE